MSVSEANLRFYLSGGPDNADPARSTGGAISSTTVGSDLFSDVSPAQAVSGFVEVRCVYFRNDDPSADGLEDPVVWIKGDLGQSRLQIGVGQKNTASRNQPTYLTASSYLNGVNLPDGPYREGEFVPIWVKRIVPRGATGHRVAAALRVRGYSV